MTATPPTLLSIMFFSFPMVRMAGTGTSFITHLLIHLFLLNGNLRTFLKHNMLRTAYIHASLSIPSFITAVASFNNTSLTCGLPLISRGYRFFALTNRNFVQLFTAVSKTGFVRTYPRDLRQRYQDAMAFARFFRNVDLLITMTTNPAWNEIQQQLFSGQTSYDRPDLVARVFKLKVGQLLQDIVKKDVFGRVSAYLYVVEFQKRELPHIHLLLILHPEDRIRSPSHIDSCIAAQWPDPERRPSLFQTVKSCMIHGPCGTANPSAPA